MSLRNLIKHDLIKTTIIALAMSIVCSTVTYFIAVRQIPKFATVDLLTLNNDFLVNLSRYQLAHGATDQQVMAMVKNYTAKIQPLLDEVSNQGNIILFQKQAIVTQSKDITSQVAKALFKDYLPDVVSDGAAANEGAVDVNEAKDVSNSNPNSPSNLQ